MGASNVVDDKNPVLVAYTVVTVHLIQLEVKIIKL